MFFIDFNRMLVSCKFVGASYFALTTFTSAKSGAQHEKIYFCHCKIESLTMTLNSLENHLKTTVQHANVFRTTEIIDASCLVFLQLWLHVYEVDFLLQSGFFFEYMFTSTDMSTLIMLIRLRFALWSIEKQSLMKILFLNYFICVKCSITPRGYG